MFVFFMMTFVVSWLNSGVRAETPTTGRLVIVGGALDLKNEAIYQAFLYGVPDDAPIGIVPLASGVPEESGRLSVQDIQQYATNPDQVFDTKLTYKEPEKAATDEVAELLRKCRALWFTGGDQSRIIAALRPSSGDTVSYKAVLDVLAAGGTVGGSSAGAAMMSDPMICGGESEEALTVGSTNQLDGPGVCIGKGMGLFPYGLSDQHFLQRGRFGRLLAALEATDLRLGFGISENSALIVDFETVLMTAMGDRGVTIIDRKQATKEDQSRKNIRVHLLGNGDTYQVKTEQVTPAEGKVELVKDLPDDGEAASFPEMWDRNVIPKMISVLSNDPAKSVRSKDKSFDYEFSADGLTKFYLAPGANPASLTASQVRLDIVPRVGANE